MHHLFPVLVAQEPLDVPGLGPLDFRCLIGIVVGQPAADAVAIPVQDAHNITSLEVTLHRHHPRGQEALAPLPQGPGGAQVHPKGAPGVEAAEHPPLPALHLGGRGGEMGTQGLAPGQSKDHILLPPVGDDHLHPRRRGQAGRLHFGDHAPDSLGVAGTSGQGLDLPIDLLHQGYESGIRGLVGVGGVEAGGVG